MGRRVWIASLAVVALGMPGGLRSVAASGRPGAAHGAQGYLGVTLRDPSGKELAEQHPGIAHCTEIVHVDHDGPAGKAGLREHDLILQVNGQAVGSQGQLHRVLHDTTPGQGVALLILRDGQTMTVNAQVADRSEVERRAWAQHILAPQPPPIATDDGGDGAPAQGFVHDAPMADAPLRPKHGLLGNVLGAPYTGLSLEAVTPQLGEYFGAQSGVGLLVRSVDANSPGMVAGLRAGDVVLKANQVTLSSEAEWTRQMHESKGQPTPVLILRDRHEQTLSLMPETRHRSALNQPEAGEWTGAMAATGRPWREGGLQRTS